jgi:hypothetical protein
MSILDKLKDKMMGRMSPEEEEIKRKADARAAEYEASTGEAAPAEPGIEEDYTAENAVSLLNPVGIVKTGVKAAAKGAARKAATGGILTKLKDLMPSRETNANVSLKKTTSDVAEKIPTRGKSVSNPLSDIPEEARHAAAANPAVLDKLKQEGSRDELLASLKSLPKDKRREAQELKDIAAGIKKPGSTTSESESFPTRDYGTMEMPSPTKSDARSAGDVSNKYWKQTDKKPDSGYVWDSGAGIMRKRRPGEQD